MVRAPYRFGMDEAARLAQALGIDAVTAIEFGVAGGAGLLEMEEEADRIKRERGVSYRIFGFGLEQGLPRPVDYRDLPYNWRPGAFRMDVAKLKAELKRADLVLGDVADTAPRFFADYKPPPVGFISFDLDFYSSTKDAFTLLESRHADDFLPRTYCYFDDVIGDHDEIHCEFVGELLAISEFNAAHTDRKLAKIHGLAYKFRAPAGWCEKIFVFHLFHHPHYNTYMRQRAPGSYLRD